MTLIPKEKIKHDFNSFAQTHTLAPSITHAQLVFKYIYSRSASEDSRLCKVES